MGVCCGWACISNTISVEILQAMYTEKPRAPNIIIYTVWIQASSRQATKLVSTHQFQQKLAAKLEAENTATTVYQTTCKVFK